MWPAIFLPLNTRPGSWRLPVEPWLRCETDTPCEARRPPKLCRFIGTGEALADRDAGDVDELAGDEVADMDLAPRPRAARSSSTRNSPTFALGSTFALAKWPRIGWVTFLALRVPTPSWTAL